MSFRGGSKGNDKDEEENSTFIFHNKNLNHKAPSLNKNVDCFLLIKLIPLELRANCHLPNPFPKTQMVEKHEVISP